MEKEATQTETLVKRLDNIYTSDIFKVFEKLTNNQSFTIKKTSMLGHKNVSYFSKLVGSAPHNVQEDMGLNPVILSGFMLKKSMFFGKW